MHTLVHNWDQPIHAATGCHWIGGRRQHLWHLRVPLTATAALRRKWQRHSSPAFSNPPPSGNLAWDMVSCFKVSLRCFVPQHVFAKVATEGWTHFHSPCMPHNVGSRKTWHIRCGSKAQQKKSKWVLPPLKHAGFEHGSHQLLPSFHILWAAKAANRVWAPDTALRFWEEPEKGAITVWSCFLTKI